MKYSSFFPFVYALLLTVWPFTASALSEREKETVRTLSNQAATDYEEGRYGLARDKFKRAFDMAPIPRLALWCARANDRLGKLSTAYEYYQQALELKRNELWRGDLQEKAQRDARVEMEQLKQRIPRLTIMVEAPPGPKVLAKVDEVPLPESVLGVEHFVDPGKRSVTGWRGGEFVQETVDLAEGEHKRIVLRFRGATTASTPIASRIEHGRSATPTRDGTVPFLQRQRTWGWIAVGAGAAGLTLGVITGIQVATEYGSLNDKCDRSRVCDVRYQSDVDAYRTQRTLSTVGFVVAGIAGAAGLTLLLTAPKTEKKHGLSLLLSPHLSGVRGEF